jgi:hypothetical protein
MVWAGRIVILFGLLLMAFGAIQMLVAQLTSADPNSSLMGNGILLTLCWYGGILLVGLGVALRGGRLSRWL